MKSTQMLAPRPRPEVLCAAPAQHGALDYGELEGMGIDPESVLDFSVNSNPYGPSPAVWDALRAVPLDRYPDRECLALRRALAAHLGVHPAHIVVGNGSAELFCLIAAAFLCPPRPGSDAPRDTVLILGPTFGEYERVARLMGATVRYYWAREEEGFIPQPARIAELLTEAHPRLVFVCNPNNPTGIVYDLAAIAAWSTAHPQTLFVVDEAYLAFAPGVRSALALDSPNILVVRSMTKDYALAGLRLGYAVGPESLIESLHRVRPAWNVNALAQAAALAALHDPVYLRQTLHMLREAKEELVVGLRALGLSPLPSATHFFLLPVGNGRAFRGALLRRGILVRDAASFGLPAYVRLATRRPEQNHRLLQAVEELGWERASCS